MSLTRNVCIFLPSPPHSISSHIRDNNACAILKEWSDPLVPVHHITHIYSVQTYYTFSRFTWHWISPHIIIRVTIIIDLRTTHSQCHMCWDLLLSQVTVSQCHDDHFYWHCASIQCNLSNLDILKTDTYNPEI